MGPILSSSNMFPDLQGFKQTRTIIEQVNTIFEQNHAQLHMNVKIMSTNINYDVMNWRKTIIPARMLIYSHGVEGKDVHTLHLSIEEIIQLYDHLKFLQKERSLTPMPSEIIIEDTDCIICFDQKALEVLPCSHAFCAGCIQKYILDKDEKQCPKCRKSYHCSRQSFSQQIYTVIDEEEMMESTRKLIIEIIGRRNGELIEKLQEKV